MQKVVELKGRRCCSRCAYPLSTCVCDSVIGCELPCKITVLQHRKESKHAKNTVRLAKLIAPDIEIILDDVECLKNGEFAAKLKDAILIYPNPHSNVLLKHDLESKHTLEDTHLLFIDATWKQAHGIWKRHPLLSTLDSYHLELSEMPEYTIRKAKRTNYLSTIEAIAYCTEILFGQDKHPYLSLLARMQSNWPSQKLSTPKS